MESTQQVGDGWVFDFKTKTITLDSSIDIAKVPLLLYAQAVFVKTKDGRMMRDRSQPLS